MKHIRVLRHNYYPYSVMYNYLIQNHNLDVTFYRINGSNKIIALTDRCGKKVDNVTEVIVEESKKIPLWKQSMNMSMGKIPKTYTTEQKFFRVTEIDKEDAIGKPIDVFEVM